MAFVVKSQIFSDRFYGFIGVLQEKTGAHKAKLVVILHGTAVKFALHQTFQMGFADVQISAHIGKRKPEMFIVENHVQKTVLKAFPIVLFGLFQKGQDEHFGTVF